VDFAADPYAAMAPDRVASVAIFNHALALGAAQRQSKAA
jgi:hypothetical protein